MFETVTFENMPDAVAFLIRKMDSMENKVQDLLASQPSNGCVTMCLDELIKYLPGHPAKQTVYGWVSEKVIPYHKINNKTLYFIKSEIDEWLSDNKCKTIADIEAEAAEFLAKKDGMRYGI